MKKFLNNPADIMEEMLEGMALANQKILYWEKGTHRIMRRSKKETGKVKIIIGRLHWMDWLRYVRYGKHGGCIRCPVWKTTL